MIEKAWEKYRQQVMPGNAGAVQIQETRRGFYAGALTVWHALLSLDDADADYVKLDQIKADLDRYVSEIAAAGAVSGDG